MLTAIVIAVVALVITLGFQIDKLQVKQRTATLDHQVSLEQKQLSGLQTSQKAVLIKVAKRNDNSATTALGKQYVATQAADKQVNGFFKVAMTFDSDQTWKARDKKVLKYATQDVVNANNPALFNDGKDDSGNSIINSTGRSAQFLDVATQYGPLQSDGTIHGIVKVHFIGSSANNSAQIEDYYIFTFDTKQNKLTEVQRFAMKSQKRVQGDNDD